MKQYLFSMVVVGGLVIGGAVAPSVASADGGMMPIVTVTTDAPVTVTPLLSTEQRIAYLEQMVKLYASVQALTLSIPELTNADEGTLTVVINDTMRFMCEGNVATAGQWCVRHVGDLGESYVDLEEIVGFPYDDRFAYDVTLTKARAATYGETDQQQYEYYLRSLNDLTFIK